MLQVLSTDSSLTPEDVDIQVTQKGPKLQVSGYGDISDSISINVEIPIVYDVTVVTSGDAGIQCRDLMESECCHLSSQAGSISVSGVKTANLRVESDTGHVSCSGAVQEGMSSN